MNKDSQPSNGLTARQHDLLGYFSDPASPSYQNGTRSAERAGYKGASGSNQLSVQASRTLKKARELGVLQGVLVEQGCTVQRAANRLSACLDAKRRRIFVTAAGIVEGPLEDAYQIQFQAAKFVLQLHGHLGCTVEEETSDTIACADPTPAGEQEQAAGELHAAMTILNTSDAVDREALRDVLECDAKSAECEGPEPQDGTDGSQGPVAEDDPGKA